MKNRKPGTVSVFRSDTLGSFCPIRVDVPRRGLARSVRRLREFGAVQTRQHDLVGCVGSWIPGLGFVAPWRDDRHAFPVTRTGKTITL